MMVAAFKSMFKWVILYTSMVARGASMRVVQLEHNAQALKLPLSPANFKKYLKQIHA